MIPDWCIFVNYGNCDMKENIFYILMASVYIIINLCDEGLLGTFMMCIHVYVGVLRDGKNSFISFNLRCFEFYYWYNFNYCFIFYINQFNMKIIRSNVMV